MWDTLHSFLQALTISSDVASFVRMSQTVAFGQIVQPDDIVLRRIKIDFVLWLELS